MIAPTAIINGLGQSIGLEIVNVEGCTGFSIIIFNYYNFVEI